MCRACCMEPCVQLLKPQNPSSMLLPSAHKWLHQYEKGAAAPAVQLSETKCPHSCVLAMCLLGKTGPMQGCLALQKLIQLSLSPEREHNQTQRRCVHENVFTSISAIHHKHKCEHKILVHSVLSNSAPHVPGHTAKRTCPNITHSSIHPSVRPSEHPSIHPTSHDP